MNTSSRIATGIIGALLLGGAPEQSVLAQDASRLPSLEEIFSDGRFQPDAITEGAWVAEGTQYAFLRRPAPGLPADLIVYDAGSGTERVVLRAADLSAETGRSVNIENYQISDDGKTVVVFADAKRLWRRKTRGYYYHADPKSAGMSPIGVHDRGLQQYGKLSPSGEWFGFVRDANLFVVDMKSGEEHPLTTADPGPGILNGTGDWVYEEELGLRDGWQWSPDSRHIAFMQLDVSRTPDFTMTDLRTNYPGYMRFRWPAAGEANAEVRIGIVDISTGETRFLDTGTWHDSTAENEYIAQFGWLPGTPDAHLWILRLNRVQNRLDVLRADAVTMDVERLVSDESEGWIKVKTGFSDLDTGAVVFLPDGRHFVLLSEQDGYRHVYLYSNSGEYLAQLTSGDWEVTGFHGLDLDARRLLVSGTYDGSLDRHLYEITWEGDAVPADTVRIRRLTPEDGWHNPSVSGTMRYFADTFSSLSEPPSTVIRNARGITLHTLVSNAALKEALTEFGLPALTLERVPATDGTPLDGWFIRPSDFDTSGTYPLLLYVYGGPGSQQVRNSWYSGRPDRHLWHAWLADQLGIVVGCVDNRGAAGRGGEFKWLPYRNLGYYEAQDQIAVARYLSKKPFIDEDRVGIWGWSYGGYMTLMSMLTHDGPSTFSVGVSVAPVTSWRLYDTIYTERYMGTPAGNPDGYARSEPLAYASRLRDEQRLLLIHGDLDDNVHVQNTVQMAERLQTEGRQFSLMLYPGAEHSLREKYQKLHVFTLITDFLKENLGSRDGRPSGP